MTNRKYSLKARHLQKPLEVMAVDSSNSLVELQEAGGDPWVTNTCLAWAIIQNDDGRVVDEWWNYDLIFPLTVEQRDVLRQHIPGFPTEALLDEVRQVWWSVVNG